MFNVIRLKATDGEEHVLFTGCTETGYSAKDVVTMPGAYSECIGAIDSSSMKLRKLVGAIGPYNTELYALCLDNKALYANDLTGNVANVLTMPATAANAMVRSMSEGLRDSINGAIAAVRFYETLSSKSNVSLPEDVLSELPEGEAAAMISAEQHYVLKDTDNHEIFQKTFDSEFGVVLPSLKEIHSVQDNYYSPLDVLRALMPYRRPGNPNVYECVYHTPYFRVGMNANIIPRHLEWIYGYESNNLLDIQPNERHMQKNMYTLYCSDVSTYICEMVTGVLFNTNYGSLFEHLRKAKDRELVGRIISDLQAGAAVGEGGKSIVCDITMSEVDALWDDGWNPSAVGNAIRSHLHMDDGFLEEIIQNTHPVRRVVSTDNQWFTLDLDGAQVQAFTAKMIEMGFISASLDRFFIRMCQCAYRASWGHSGVARAVPILVSHGAMGANDKAFSAFLNDCEAGKVCNAADYPRLFARTYSRPARNPDEEDEDLIGGLGSEDEDELDGLDFEYYLTRQNYAALSAGEIDLTNIMDIRSGESETDRVSRLRSLGGESTVVERWKLVDGQSNLDYFLTTAHAQTADVNIYIQAFIRLCRWGTRRPNMLVFQDHPEIRHVFDLNLGIEADNTSIVNEDDLVKVNGCDYSLVGFLNTTTNRTVDAKHIIGFILQKDYGTVTRQYLAAWDDLAEMVEQNTINIGEFKVGATVDISKLVGVETFEKKSYEVYESDRNISEGMKLKIRGRELSSICLLPHPGITQERAYLKSLTTDTVESTRDRQYDRLSRYLKCLHSFYDVHGNELSAIRTTMDLQALALAYAEMSKNGPAQKTDSNTATANSALKKLSLGGGAQPEYDDRQLTGKFVLVDDPSNLAVADNAWEPLTFTDPRMAPLNPTGKHSIVLLMLKTRDCWMLCRKDIAYEELDLDRSAAGIRPCHVPYSEIRKVVAALRVGKSPTLKGLPFKLHSSIRLD